ncbi:hypothetical protein QYF36_019367 [Acer negundo]|nr:hypothetical protein QYF36_019367 [Acer negundo]
MSDSEDKVPNENNGIKDGVPNENNGIVDEVPNDSRDEDYGLSDVNKDDIAEKEVIDNHIICTAFRPRDDGRITLETFKNDHNCLAVPKNRDVTSVWFKLDYLRDIFWPAATSSNKVAFLKVIDEIKQTSLEAHAYLNKNLWLNENFETILPPIRKMGVGKPRLSRRRGSTEPKKVQRSVGFKCGICKEVGHNSRTCKNTSTTETEKPPLRRRFRLVRDEMEAATDYTKLLTNLLSGAAGEVDYFQRGKDYVENLRREHLELYKDIGLQDNGAGLKGPTDNSNDAVGNKQVATDRFMLEHFCK